MTINKRNTFGKYGEPWKQDYHVIKKLGWQDVSNLINSMKDASRIVTCVNFCAGFKNKHLAQMKSLKEIEEFVQSRDKDWLELNAEKEKLEKSIDAAAKYIYARCRYPHVTSAEAIRELLINEPEGVLKEIEEDSDKEENV